MSASTFRQLVAEVAAKAKEKLPQAVNGRVESAVKLVLAHDVLFLEDGTVEVGSASDPLKTYTLAGHACDCQDFAYGQTPGGWCQHRIAAGIAKRVQQLLPVVPEVVEPWPDNDPEDVAPTTPAPAVPLPEAPASANCHITIAGRQVQLTLRDTDEARLLQRLAVVLAQYPATATPPPQGQDATPQCPTHGVLRQGKRGWFCPRQLDDGTWCKSKAK